MIDHSGSTAREWLWTLGVWGLLLLPVGWGWGFTVDDAWIPARVARHLEQGLGYRFNPSGPVVDAVTPLGWANALAWWAGSTVTETVHRARLLGVAAWGVGAFALSRHVLGMTGDWRRFSAVAVCSLSLPLGAWVGAGLETGVVTALCACAVAWPRVAPVFLGWAAAWRPELLPWACVVSVAYPAPNGWRQLGRLVGTVLPAIAIGLIRYSLFHSFVPLAFFAKPSDLEHGIRYVWGAFRFTGLPWLLLSLRYRSTERYYRGIAIATLVHGVALCFAGGDWMSLFRLAVPVLPGALLVAARLAPVIPDWALAVKSAIAIACLLALHGSHGAPARRIWQQRAELIATAAPGLVGLAPVGSPDVGWVGATIDGDVIDLSGVTDPGVAFLPGGHTSKRLPTVFLSQRKIRALLALVDATGAPVRDIDRQVLALGEQEGFEPVRQLEIPGAVTGYVQLVKPSPSAGSGR